MDIGPARKLSQREVLVQLSFFRSACMTRPVAWWTLEGSRPARGCFP